MNLFDEVLRGMEELKLIVQGKEKPLTVRQAAAYLSISEYTLREKMRTGEIRFFKPAGGKIIYFHPADLRAYAYRNGSTTAEEIEEKATNVVAFNPRKRRA